MDKSDTGELNRGSNRFHTTHWSLVVAASGNSKQALEELCSAYWPPLCSYAIRLGLGANEAEDVTQAFFVRLIEKNLAALANSHRGRFRTFLLTAFRRFIINEWKYENTLKRGGGFQIVSINRGESADSMELRSQCDLTADQQFERQWALTVLQRAYRNLSDEYSELNQLNLFEALVPYLYGDNEASYARLAITLNTTAGALRMASSRLRSRWREKIRDEIRKTVADDSEVDDEVLSLLKALQSM